MAGMNGQRPDNRLTVRHVLIAAFAALLGFQWSSCYCPAHAGRRCAQMQPYEGPSADGVSRRR
jgi:hypothetical protein